jgi:GNAT superfamily N-acetyltransferase
MMQAKLNDFSSTVLISAIEESLREFWGNWGRAPGSELYDGPELMRLYTGVPYAFCNGIVCSQLSSINVDTVIDDIVSYFYERNAIWEWIVGPNATPTSLETTLLSHGLVVRAESTGMAVNLNGLSQDTPSTSNFRIIQVSDDKTLKLWANKMMEGFESPTLYPTFIDLECSLGCNNPAYRRYLGIWDGQPVSTSALFLGEKVAGIYCVSTLPTARKMGMGKAITLHALREAKAKGYHIAVLQSSPMGRTVYQRLGFRQYSVLRDYCPAK